MSSVVRPLQIIVIDTDPATCLGLRIAVETCRFHVAVVAEYHSADEALALLAQCPAAVIVLDPEIDGGAGHAVLQWSRRQQPMVPCLARLAREDAEAIYAALKAGACGVVLRREELEVQIFALLTIVGMRSHLSPGAAKMLAGGVTAQVLDRPARDLKTLAAREREVFLLLGKGHKTQDIAQRLHISQKTVQGHLGRIKTKLHLLDHAQLCRRAALAQAGAPRRRGRDVGTSRVKRCG